jgi:hypothetical protein
VTPGQNRKSAKERKPEIKRRLSFFFALSPSRAFAIVFSLHRDVAPAPLLSRLKTAAGGPTCRILANGPCSPRSKRYDAALTSEYVHDCRLPHVRNQKGRVV